jgi:hypothetical protein
MSNTSYMASEALTVTIDFIRAALVMIRVLGHRRKEGVTQIERYYTCDLSARPMECG